jgi:chromosomal replication initiation ATPase DnaA
MKHFKQQFEGIIRGVAEVYRVTPEEILGRSRFEPIAEARQVAMVITWRSLNGAWSKTGRLFKRHHGTVMHAKSAVERRVMSDPLSLARWKEARGLVVKGPIDYQI